MKQLNRKYAFGLRPLTVVFISVIGLAQATSPKPVAIVPFELVLNHVFVRASVNNSEPLSLVVDTGVLDTLIDASRSIQLRLPSSGDISVPGFGSQQPARGHNVAIRSISLNGVELDNISAHSAPLDLFSQLLGHTIDAVIGADLFNKYVVELDYSKRVLRLYDPASYTEPKEGCQLPLLLDTSPGYPKIHAQLMGDDGESIDTMLILDTGANYLIITKSFGDDHPNLPSDRKTIDAAPRKVFSGITQFRAGRVRAVNLGGCIVENPIAVFSQDLTGLGAGSNNFSGMAGMNVLENFTTVFDYQHRLVTFTRNRSVTDTPQYDMTGIHVLASGAEFHDFTVDYVLRQSPGARKDIHVGDKIESVDHLPAAQLSQNDLFGDLGLYAW
jgi:hypothetical protein